MLNPQPPREPFRGRYAIRNGLWNSSQTRYGFRNDPGKSSRGRYRICNGPGHSPRPRYEFVAGSSQSWHVPGPGIPPRSIGREATGYEIAFLRPFDLPRSTVVYRRLGTRCPRRSVVEWTGRRYASSASERSAGGRAPPAIRRYSSSSWAPGIFRATLRRYCAYLRHRDASEMNPEQRSGRSSAKIASQCVRRESSG